MKERPILFSGPMVRAILKGRKTQTRRVVKPQPKFKDFEDGRMLAFVDKWGYCPVERNLHLCPYGSTGDRLWVRETWHGSGNKKLALNPEHPMDSLSYRADWHGVDTGLIWKPSIHMPRWASRITLEVKGVRVERLQDISEDDAKAEGVTPKGDTYIAANVAKDSPHRMEFWTLWQSINAKRGFGWDTNPWVWVIEFQPITPSDSTAKLKSASSAALTGNEQSDGGNFGKGNV